MSSIACTGCGATINPEADPSFCPICGSEDRQAAAHDAAALKVYEDIRLAKRKHSGTKSREDLGRAQPIRDRRTELAQAGR